MELFKFVLEKVLVPLVIGAIGAQLALKKHQKERWWTLKEETYRVLIQHLAKQRALLKKWIEEYEHSANTVNNPEDEKDSLVFREARRQIREHAAQGGYVISKDAARTLDRVMETWDAPDDEDVRWNMERELSAVEKALMHLQEIARKELGVR